MMNHTKETIKKHLSPWALVAWLALLGVAFCVDVARDAEGGVSIELREFR